MRKLIHGMEMPQKCGQCKLFHAEHPMYCTATEGHRTVGAPYGMPRPDWCPLLKKEEEYRESTSYRFEKGYILKKQTDLFAPHGL